MSRARDYNAAVSQIQTYAYLGILAGLGAIVLGFQGNTWLNGALAVGGGVLILDCVWIIRSPLAPGVRGLSASLFIVGLYFLARPDLSIGAVWGAIACIAGAWHVFVDYRRITKGDLAGALTMPPTPEQLAADQLDAVVDDVRASTMKSDPQHVQFMTADLFKRLTWDGRLRQTDAVLAAKNGSRGVNPAFAPGPHFEVVPKADVEIIPGRKHLFRSIFNATFMLSGRRLRGTITQESLDRYNRWKES